MTERRLKETIATYNAVASDYEQRTNHLAPTEELPRFTRLLAAGAKLLGKTSISMDVSRGKYLKDGC